MDTSIAAGGASEGVGEVRSAGRLSTKFVGHLLRFADLTAVAVLGLGIYWIYVHPLKDGLASEYLAAILVGSLMSAAHFQWFGAYQGEYVFCRSMRLERALAAWCCTFGVLLALAFALKISASYSRVWLFTWFASTAGALTFGRIVLRQLVHRWAREGRFANRTVIIGAGEQGRRLAAFLNREGDVRTRIIGFVDDRMTRVQGAEGHQVLGNTKDLLEMVRNNMVDQILIALPWTAEERIRQLIHALSAAPVPVHLAPDLAGIALNTLPVAQVSRLPMLQVLERPISGWSYVLKTIEDKVLAVVILTFLAPLMLVIAAAIKLDSPGPLLFRQNRFGFNNQLIGVYKFRTMHSNQCDFGAETLATRNDPRVTRVGRFLRRTSLDELPQFFNVLLGHMSVVGPRPHAVMAKAAGRLYQDVVKEYSVRHKVKPGITGWAQVNGFRGETDTEEKIIGRVKHDLYYIENWTIWLDLYIVLKTVFVLFRDENAY